MASRASAEFQTPTHKTSATFPLGKSVSDRGLAHYCGYQLSNEIKNCARRHQPPACHTIVTRTDKSRAISAASSPFFDRPFAEELRSSEPSRRDVLVSSIARRISAPPWLEGCDNGQLSSPLRDTSRTGAPYIGTYTADNRVLATGSLPTTARAPRQDSTSHVLFGKKSGGRGQWHMCRGIDHKPVERHRTKHLDGRGGISGLVWPSSPQNPASPRTVSQPLRASGGVLNSVPRDGFLLA